MSKTILCLTVNGWLLHRKAGIVDFTDQELSDAVLKGRGIIRETESLIFAIDMYCPVEGMEDGNVRALREYEASGKEEEK